jgi:putative ABC transport system substrate-binding protein
MKRREFITLMGGAAAAWPPAARAQLPKMPVVGMLNGGTPAGYAPYLTAFHSGLKEAGYVEGRDVLIEYRWAEGQYNRLPAIAAELVERQPSAIVANSPAVLAVRAATTTIPIIFTTARDPVQMGLVASLARPGGNLTGVTQLGVEVAAKRLELAHEIMPGASVIAALINPTNPATAESQLSELQTAARVFGLQLRILHASTDTDFDSVFATLRQEHIGALVIGTDGFLLSRTEQLAELTVRHRVPAIFQDRAFAAAGGLMSYGGSTTDQYRQAGIYTGRVLKGEKPADLPVVRSTKVELIINVRAAKALGLTVPVTLLGRADEVIE